MGKSGGSTISGKYGARQTGRGEPFSGYRSGNVSHPFQSQAVSLPAPSLRSPAVPAFQPGGARENAPPPLLKAEPRENPPPPSRPGRYARTAPARQGSSQARGGVH